MGGVGFEGWGWVGVGVGVGAVIVVGFSGWVELDLGLDLVHIDPFNAFCFVAVEVELTTLTTRFV